MSSGPSSFTLVCPVCHKRFAGDPARPHSTYQCPDDETTLVREPSVPADSTIRIVPDALPPTTLREGTGRHSVISLVQTSEGREGAAPALPLKEKYEVVGELGKGGMGQVLKVKDRDLKREVAMKKLLPVSPAEGSAATQDAVLRFIEEAQATGQLEHPNIVPVHDLGIDSDGRIYFTLKYVEGNSLKQVIRGRKANARTDDGSARFRDIYSPLRMIEILISICQAVAYAHSKNIIHRDLKPDNVMLGKYGEVLVMDWGLAKFLGDHDGARTPTGTVRISPGSAAGIPDSTMEGSIAGTPAYMSPEQAAGKIRELDQRTDVYSLGAILYEMLTGSPPYEGSGAMEVLEKVEQGPPRPLKKQRGTFGFSPIPRELAAICNKAMERKREQRYATAGEMRLDLQAFLENLPVSAAPDSVRQRFGKWVKRNRRQVQSSALSAAAVLIVVVAGWYGWNTWRVSQLLAEGQNLLEISRREYNAKPPSAQVNPGDAYAAQMALSLWAQRAGNFRRRLQEAMNPLTRALDISPRNVRARTLLAEANMDLWRLAIQENNTELAEVNRREVESLAPDPSLYATELNGFGTFEAAFDAPDAETYLFSFETLNVLGKDGVAQPPRLIPVPYDINARRADIDFLYREQLRINAGKPLPADKHSIFNLEPTPASKVGSGGKVMISALPPGRYLLLVRAEGRIEVRISLRMERLGKVKQDYVLPTVEQNPAGFFYMAGGEIMIGGETAGAAAPHTMRIPPAWIYHDEISMGEYGAFLKSLVETGAAGQAEAQRRLPRDFGKNLATLGPGGLLLPADARIDAAAFALSPARGISFSDAEAYIAWRGKQEGLPYRLPRDWEWEAACRGADGRKYSWGDTPGEGLAVVTQGYGDTGSSMSWKWEDYKDESPWGIHNLAGAAAEWTSSPYDPNAKPEDPVFGQYAIRGNAWALPPVGLECAFRTSGQPDYFHPTIGFRMALDHPYSK